MKKSAYERMVETKRKNNTYEQIAIKTSNKKQKYIEDFEKTNDCTMVYTLVRKYGQGWYKAHILAPEDYLKSDYRTWDLHFVKNSSIHKIIDYAAFTCLNQASIGEKMC